MARLRLAGLSFAVLLAATSAVAQEPPVIRVNVPMVQVDVIVRGKDGPVAGLTKQDFTILDKGKPQRIASFNVSVLNGTASSPVRTTPLAPGTVANRLDSDGEEPRAPTVILWDTLNTEVEDQSYVGAQVIKYLTGMQAGDHFALFRLTRRLTVVQDFTNDPKPLLAAVKKSQAEQSQTLGANTLTDGIGDIDNPVMEALGAAGLADSAEMAANAAKEMTDYALRDRVFITEAALEQVARHLAGLRGRKKLIWVSGTFPVRTLDQRTRNGQSALEIQDFGPQLEKAIRVLNESHVAVYPVDPRGLTTGAAQASGGKGARSDQSGVGGYLAPGIDTMQLFAHQTGGRAFYADNELVAAVKAAVEDDAIVYALGFYPSSEKFDGTYHSITVKVDRKGVELHHRAGYYASDQRVPDHANDRDLLNEAIQNPLDSTQIGLRARLIPAEDRPGLYQLEVVIDTSDLHLERVSDRWVGTVDYATSVTPTDKPTGALETVKLALSDARLKESLDRGFTFRREIAVGDLKGDLRIAIQDRATGAIGSLHVPLGR